MDCAVPQRAPRTEGTKQGGSGPKSDAILIHTRQSPSIFSNTTISLDARRSRYAAADQIVRSIRQVKDATTPRAKGVHQHRTKGESSNQAPHLETWATTRFHEQEPRAARGKEAYWWVAKRSSRARQACAARRWLLPPSLPRIMSAD